MQGEQSQRLGQSTTRLLAVCLGIAGLAFVAGVSVKMVGAAWQDPVQPPPNGGTPPINTGDAAQIKGGGLHVADTPGGDSRFRVGNNPNSGTSIGEIDADGWQRALSLKNADARAINIDGVGGLTDRGVNIENVSEYGIYINGGGLADTGVRVENVADTAIYAGGLIYGVYGEASSGSSFGDTYGIYGQGANINDFGSPTRAGVYGKAGNVAGVAIGGVTAGLYASTGDTSNGETYGLYAENNVTLGTGKSYASFFKGKNRIEDNHAAGPASVVENALDIYVNSGTKGSGLYIEQDAANLQTFGLYVSGGGSGAIRGIGGQAGVFGKPNNASLDAYGVYGQASGGVGGGNKHGVYADTGNDSMPVSGNIYGLYVANNSRQISSNRWTAFFKDNVSTNQPTVQIQSQSSEYGLRVEGGSGAAIRAFSGSNNSAVLGTAGTPSAQSSTYGIYGQASGTADNQGAKSYGVYGYAENRLSTYGVAGESVGSSAAVYGTNDDPSSGGHAGLFDGSLRVVKDGFFADTSAFIEDYLFAAMGSGSAVVFGADTNIDSKLIVDGKGRFNDTLKTPDFRVKNQWPLDGSGSYHKLYLNVNDSDEAQLCTSTGTEACTDNEPPVNCNANGTQEKFLGVNHENGNTLCANFCNGITPADIECSWACDGTNSDPLCNLKGSETHGTKNCTNKKFQEYDSGSGICTCFFGGGVGDTYTQTKLSHPTTLCVDMAGAEFSHAPPP